MRTQTPSRSENGNGNGHALILAQRDEERRGLANLLAKNSLVPDHFRSKPGNVFAALMIAERHGLDFFFVASNLIEVHGRYGWNGQGLIGLLRARGAIKGTLRYETEEHETDGLRVRASATDAETGEKVTGMWVSMAMAKREGWDRNKKYQTMPEVMLTYRAATIFVRTHYPDVLMGFREVGEIEDMAASGQIEPREVEVEVRERLDSLNAAAGLDDEEGPRDVEPEDASDDGDDDSGVDETGQRIGF